MMTNPSRTVRRVLPDPRTQQKRRMRTLNRIVLLCSALFIPLYLAIRLTGGSAEKLEKLPDLLSRIKTPVLWQVPGDCVRYESFFYGYPEDGSRGTTVFPTDR